MGRFLGLSAGMGFEKGSASRRTLIKFSIYALISRVFLAANAALSPETCRYRARSVQRHTRSILHAVSQLAGCGLPPWGRLRLTS